MDQNAREFLADARNKYFFEPGELDLPEQFVDPSIPKLG